MEPSEPKNEELKKESQNNPENNENKLENENEIENEIEKDNENENENEKEDEINAVEDNTNSSISTGCRCEEEMSYHLRFHNAILANDITQLKQLISQSNLKNSIILHSHSQKEH